MRLSIVTGWLANLVDMNDRDHDDTQPVQPTPDPAYGDQSADRPDTPADDHLVFGPPPPPSYPPPGLGQQSGQPSGQPIGPQPTAAYPTAVTTPPARGRKGFAAGVIAASLVLGGAAGVGGAAAWSAFDDDTASASSSSGSRTTSQVVDSADTPAADGSVESVASSVLPSVVKIDVSGAQGAGSGSGIILSSDGQILTNDHVVELAGEGGQGGTITVSFNDGTTAQAEVLGTDPLTDVAVIQAQDVDGLTPATLGSSDDLAVGEGVVAIGSPFGLDATVTSGIVSALNRPVDVGSDGEGNVTAYPAIQTDAAINPGNSGGALVDMNGHVVGINSSIQSTSSGSGLGGGEAGSIGLGFAIPIDDALPIVDQIIDGETPTHARLGITVANAAAQGTGGTVQNETSEGAQIQDIGDGSAAGDAGLESGDVIVKVDDQLVTTSDDLIATIRSYRPGDTVTITYLRNGDEKTTELELDSDAASSNS